MVIDCPHCFTKVISKPDGSCPACQGNTRASTASTDHTAVRIAHGEELPLICCGCGGPADHYHTITQHSSEGRAEGAGVMALLLALISWPAALLMFVRGLQETSVVRVKLPFCSRCRQLGAPTPKYVDFKNARMTFIVHKRLKEAIDPTGGTEWAIPLRE